MLFTLTPYRRATIECPSSCRSTEANSPSAVIRPSRYGIQAWWSDGWSSTPTCCAQKPTRPAPAGSAVDAAAKAIKAAKKPVVLLGGQACLADGLKAAARLEAAGVTVEMKQITNIPKSTVDLDADTARKVLKLMEALDDHDDVQSVSANFNIPEETMAEIGAG